jgi:hypothetical protein
MRFKRERRNAKSASGTSLAANGAQFVGPLRDEAVP